MQNTVVSALAALFEGRDTGRLALAVGVLVLLVLAWRKVRDLLVMAVVFGALLVAQQADQGAPDSADPMPEAASAQTVVLA